MNVPKLRFKDENKADYPEWEIGELKQFCQVNPKAENLPDEFIYIDLESVESGQLLKESLILLEDAPSRAQRLLQVNDVLFQMVRPYQQNNLFFDKVGQYVASTGYAQIRTTENPKFLYYCLHVQEFVSEVMNRCTGTSYPAINSADLETIEIAKPFIEEQQKIANFLSAVDDKITFLTAQKTALTQYKQGMMQRIFAQTLRFKDDNGADYPEWNDSELGKLCTITTGKLDANAMVENGKYRFYTCAQDYYFIDNYAFDTDALLISGNGANVGYIHHYNGKFNAYQRTYVLDGFTESIVFIKYYLEQFLHIRIFTEKKEGNTPYIVMSVLSEMPIRLPIYEEQTKIAQFLTECDGKINAVDTQILSAQQWKQGLLQQMFV